MKMKRMLSMILALVMVLGMLPVQALAVDVSGSEIPVADNVLDITDRTIGSISKYYGKVVSLTIGGATVQEAYEDGTTIYAVLGSDTPADATVTTAFNSEVNKFTVEGTNGSITLVDGAGEISQTLNAKYSGSISRGTATYTVIFQTDAVPTEAPTRLMETDECSAYAGIAVELNLGDYFENAQTYYLVEGDTKTALEGRKYTFRAESGGDYELVFAAANVVGECADYVTVTIHVTELESGIWLNYAYGSGALNYVQFSDADGAPIDGLKAELEGKTIRVTLPKSYDLSGKVTATFNRTSGDSNGFPKLSSSSAWNQGSGSWSDVFTNTLSGGAATRNVYLYNSQPSATSNPYETWTIQYKIDNDLPVLAGDSSASATVEANQEYTLDLAPLFTDANDSELTYQYKVDDGAWTDCGAAFAYTSSLSGEYVLSFRAFDGKDHSEEIYTVNLTITDSTETYDVTVTAPEGVAPVFYVADDAGNVRNELTAEASGDGYVVKVPVNVTAIGWRADGMGMHTAASAGLSLELVRADFVVMAGENEDTGAAVTVQYGDVAAVGNGNSFLLLGGITYSVNASANVSGYNGAALTDYAPVNGENVIELVLKHFTVTAPAGSVVSAGTLSGSFSYSFATPIDVRNEGDTVVYRFAPLSGAAFIRVQNPDDDAVTYWDFKSSKADGKSITVTEEMLFMNDAGTEGEFNSDTVYRNFEYYSFDLGDVYMNINNQGYLDLDVGEVKALNMFRNWQAINSYTNDKIAIPDFEYEIVNIEGENVVSIVPDANNTGAATMTAIGEGTAIVLVTYDAMYSELTATGSLGGEGGGNRLSAIWPDRTGVFVVSVGKDGTAIQSNMTCNGAIFDAEHSPQFYHGEEGAVVSFTPEAGVTVTVNRSTVGEKKLSFGAFTSEGVSVDPETGEVTVTGLTTGRHILRFEKDGVAGYQVVTATKTTVTMTDSEGNELPLEEKLQPGQTVTLTVTGLTNPAEKFATKYNFNCQITYKDQFGSGYSNSSGATYGKYDFSSIPQVVSVTIPEDWTESTLTLNGFMKMGGFAGDGIGSHRKVSYGDNRGMAQGADAGMELGSLPEIVLNVAVHEHSYEAVVTAPSCTEGGYTTYTCACGESYVSDETEALGHSYVCGTCTRCGYVDEEYVAPTVTVTLSLSADEHYMVGPGSDAIMALKDITVPYFDLGLYGLEQYYFVSEVYGDDGDGLPGSNLEPGTPEYADGKVTLLHLYIYALEVYYCGIDPEEAGQGYLYNEGLMGTEVFTISGGVGSSFMNQFWGGDCNLNYYVNYEYPLASSGWGATCDQILLRDGDIITLGHFTGWSFYGDSYSIFNYITADREIVTAGEELTLTLYYAGANMGMTDGTAQNLNPYCLDVYYAPYEDIPSEYVTDWEYLGTADENGELTVDTSVFGEGEYIIAVAGQYGVDFPDDICSTPGGVRIFVEKPAHEHSYEAVVTAPTCTEGGYTTYTCSCGDSYVADETPALGHTEEILPAVEPTCTESGLTEGKKCAVCGEILVAQEVVEALGHDYVDGSCTRCGLEVIASGWSGYTLWKLTSDGVLTISPSGSSYNGKVNMKHYWKVNGVLTLPWTPYADQIVKIVVEEGVNGIGQMAFYDLPNLREVVLADSVDEIYGYNFKNCGNLTTINLEHVKFIRQGAFYGCTGLTDVTFHEEVYIEEWAFAHTHVILP